MKLKNTFNPASIDKDALGFSSSGRSFWSRSSASPFVEIMDLPGRALQKTNDEQIFCVTYAFQFSRVRSSTVCNDSGKCKENNCTTCSGLPIVMQCFLHSLLPEASIVNHIQSALSGFNREDGCTKQQLGLSKVEELVTHPISRQQKRISRAVAFDSRLYSEDDSFVNRLSRRNNSLFFFRETSHHNSDV